MQSLQYQGWKQDAAVAAAAEELDQRVSRPLIVYWKDNFTIHQVKVVCFMLRLPTHKRRPIISLFSNKQ